MYMYVWLYNTLSRWVRRNRTLITNLAISFGVMMIPVGLILGATKQISTEWVGVIGVIGFGSLIWAVFRANKEDKERKYHTRLFEALVSKMGVDVDTIKRKEGLCLISGTCLKSNEGDRCQWLI